MSSNRMNCTAFLCGIALMAMPVVASARSTAASTKVEKKSIQLDDPATIDGKALKPGKYEVLIKGDKVSFELDGQTVVTAPCDWKPLGFKAPYNSMSISSHKVLREIQFEGNNKALEVL